MLKLLYHMVMEKYCGWRTKRYIRQLRALSEEHGLPSLDGYSDEAIIESLKRRKAKKASLTSERLR